MKNLFALYIMLYLFTSCQKKHGYVCYCTTEEYSLLSSQPMITKKSYTIYNTQKKAQRECDGYEAKTSFTVTTCSLTQ